MYVILYTYLHTYLPIVQNLSLPTYLSANNVSLLHLSFFLFSLVLKVFQLQWNKTSAQRHLKDDGTKFRGLKFDHGLPFHNIFTSCNHK